MATRRRSLSGVLFWCCALLVAVPATGQTDSTAPAAHPKAAPQVFVSGGFPGVETSLTWAVLKDFALSDVSDLRELLGRSSINSTSTMGFNVAVTGNRTPWLGATLEAGGSFLKQGLVGFDNVLIDFEIQEWTVLAGPKFTIRQAGIVEPFVQFLAGGAYVSFEAPFDGVSFDFWDFVLQPGVGVDVVVSETVAVRLGFDGRVLSDRAFKGPSSNQFRFTLGVTFRAAHR